MRPPKRKRSRVTLILSECEVIVRGLASTTSMRSIASQLKHSPSTISREIKRNGGIHTYYANESDTAAWQHAQRPEESKLAINKTLCHRVANMLQRHWSPQQIMGWLKREYPGDASTSVESATQTEH